MSQAILWGSARGSGRSESILIRVSITTASHHILFTLDPLADTAGVDAFCPIGPVLVSPRQLPNQGLLSLNVKVNSEEQEIRGLGYYEEIQV
jgi:hypothetical protein